MNINNVNLAGNIGNIEIKETKKCNSFAVLTLATNKNITDKDGKKTQQTQWHTLNIYGKKVDYARKLVKGDPITVYGELEYSSWEAEDGKQRTSAYILVRSFYKIESLGDKGDDAAGDEHEPI